jgi:alcohol dehydrogenase
MKPFDFQPTTRVIFGTNSLDQLGKLVKEYNAPRVLIVTDPGIVQAGYADRAQSLLRKENVESFIFSGVAENPGESDVEKGAEFARTIGPIDLIVGLGGGSPMDCAKGINFLLTNGGRMTDYWGFNKATKPMLPSIGIPTTAGTGSEAQSFALISQKDAHIKMACGDIKARFRIVILDPLLTITAPQTVTAISGIDAIGHAVETFVTKTRNPLSQMYSMEAWKLLHTNFDKVLHGPENVDARGAMLLGSHFAGVAIEYSMLGAAHACANPLTSQFGITHGIAVGLMLPAVINFNGPVVSDEYRRLDENLAETSSILDKSLPCPRVFGISPSMKKLCPISQPKQPLNGPARTIPDR